MMSTQMRWSRRRWLLSAALLAAGGRAATGGEPTPAESAKLRGSIPVHSRVVRLKSPDRRLTSTTITAVAADPRGELLAVAGDDFVIRILNVQSLAVVNRLPGHRDLIRTLAFDPGGKLLASAGNDGQLIVWNRQQNFQRLQELTDTPALACVTFSPEGGELAAVGFDDTVFLLGGGGESCPPLRCGCTDLRSVAYRADGQLLVVGGRSGELHQFDLQGHELVGIDLVHQERIRDLTFHHDGNRVVSVGEDGVVSVFDTRRREVVQQARVTQSRLFAVAVVDSQHVAVAGSDNLVRLVNTDSGNVVSTLTGHRGSIASLASTGGFLFSGGYDATLRRWSLGGLGTTQQRIAEGNPGIDR